MIFSLHYLFNLFFASFLCYWVVSKDWLNIAWELSVSYILKSPWYWAYIGFFACVAIPWFLFIFLPIHHSQPVVWVRLTMTPAAHMAQDLAVEDMLCICWSSWGWGAVSPAGSPNGAVGTRGCWCLIGLCGWERLPEDETSKRADPTRAEPDSCLRCWAFGSSQARHTFRFVSQNGLFLSKQFELGFCHMKFPESS